MFLHRGLRSFWVNVWAHQARRRHKAPQILRTPVVGAVVTKLLGQCLGTRLADGPRPPKFFVHLYLLTRHWRRHRLWHRPWHWHRQRRRCDTGLAQVLALALAMDMTQALAQALALSMAMGGVCVQWGVCNFTGRGQQMPYTRSPAAKPPWTHSPTCLHQLAELL